MSGLGSSQLVVLTERLSARDRAMAELIARLRLVSGRQLERVFFPGPPSPSRARSARRALARLSDLRVLARLERRVGGVRAGSAGHVYCLDVAGQRLVAYWNGKGLTRSRSVYEPESPFVRHGLAVSELYVRLVEAEQGGQLELMAFDAEPVCWRSFTGVAGNLVTLKPDSFVSLGVGLDELSSFVEVDCGTEGRGALSRKCQAYIDYFRSGGEQVAHGIFPRVVWLTTTQRRVGLITEVCASLPPETWRLFVVGTGGQDVGLLTGMAGAAS